MKYNELVSLEDLPDPNGPTENICLDIYNDIWACMRFRNHVGLHADFYDDAQGYCRVAKVWGRATQAVVG